MRAYVVVGLGFGDEGKGAVVDGLVRREGAGLVVRFNGGAQAAHHAVEKNGRQHRCSTWGAGTLAGARTHLGPRVLYDPVSASGEARRLVAAGVERPWGLLTADPRCPVVTPWHVALNRAEARLSGHGSCGMGIGALARDVAEGLDVLTVGDLYGLDARAVAVKADAIRCRLLAAWPVPEADAATLLLKRTSVAAWVDGVRRDTSPEATHQPPLPSVVVFEGAQGVLLDETHGFHPHTTWSTTTTRHALDLIGQWARDGQTWEDVEVSTLGVLRAYATRHGAGPFPTEVRQIPISDPRAAWLRGEHNDTGAWQGPFRVGHFDAVLARYAMRACPVDALAVTCLDRVERLSEWKMADAYWHETWGRPMEAMDYDPRDATLERQQALGAALREVAPVYYEARGRDAHELIEDRLGVPVAVEGRGPTAHDQVCWRHQLKAKVVA